MEGKEDLKISLCMTDAHFSNRLLGPLRCVHEKVIKNAVHYEDLRSRLLMLPHARAFWDAQPLSEISPKDTLR